MSNVSAVANTVHPLFNTTTSSVGACLVNTSSASASYTRRRLLQQVVSSTTATKDVTLTLVLPPALSTSNKQSLLSQSVAAVPSALSATLLGAPTVEVVSIPSTLCWTLSCSASLLSVLHITATACFVANTTTVNVADGYGHIRPAYPLEAAHGQINITSTPVNLLKVGESWTLSATSSKSYLFTASTWLPQAGLTVQLSSPPTFLGQKLSTITSVDPAKGAIGSSLSITQVSSC